MLIRGIASLSRWDGSTHVNRPSPSIAGDVIADLRTQGNKLSVWLANNDDDIEDAVVAITLNRDKVSKVVALLLDEKELKNMEIDLSDSEMGSAPGAVEAIKKKHRDLIEIDYKCLGCLSEHMMKLTHDRSKRKEFSEKEIKKLLESYRKENKIDPTEMKKSLLEDLHWS